MKSTLNFLLALFVVLLGGRTEAFAECKTSFVTHRTMAVARFLHPSQAADLEAAANGLMKKKQAEEEQPNLKTQGEVVVVKTGLSKDISKKLKMLWPFKGTNSTTAEATPPNA
jgi:uncharacterized protein (DUF2147 family)